jgi:hypothetical protein
VLAAAEACVREIMELYANMSQETVRADVRILCETEPASKPLDRRKCWHF